MMNYLKTMFSGTQVQPKASGFDRGDISQVLSEEEMSDIFSAQLGGKVTLTEVKPRSQKNVMGHCQQKVTV